VKCYLRTEKNGLCHELDYLHELADKSPRKANAYLGKAISFVAPFTSAEDDVCLSYYGYVGRLLHFAVAEGRAFVVQDSGREAVQFRPGELLRVSGRISAVSAQRVMLLNSEGTPGYPNEIKIERIKEASR